MSKQEENFIEWVENNYNINDKTDVYEEQTDFTLEMELPEGYAEIDATVYSTHIQEEGGEHDEILTTFQNKRLQINKLEWFDVCENQIKVSDRFKNRIENILNGQFYD